MTAHNPEQCKSIFVTYSWLFGVLFGVVAAIISITWAGSGTLTTVQLTLKDQGTRINVLEAQTDKIDTILYILRAR